MPEHDEVINPPQLALRIADQVDRAIDGVAPEGQAIITYEEIPGEFVDGTSYSLRKPTIKFVNLGYGELPADTLASASLTPMQERSPATRLS